MVYVNITNFCDNQLTVKNHNRTVDHRSSFVLSKKKTLTLALIWLSGSE